MGEILSGFYTKILRDLSSFIHKNSIRFSLDLGIQISKFPRLCQELWQFMYSGLISIFEQIPILFSLIFIIFLIYGFSSYDLNLETGYSVDDRRRKVTFFLGASR